MTLEAELLRAHADNDLPALISGYLAAADAAGTDDSAGFFLTHAWVFALEAGDPRAKDIKARLVAQGREVET